VITPNESVTWVPRNRPKDGPSHLPLLLIVGDSRGRVPPARQRVTTFSGTLVVGRREASQTEPRQASLVLADRMVSSQHLSIAPAPEEGSFEITDLSSTNGTVVDGEAVEFDHGCRQQSAAAGCATDRPSACSEGPRSRSRWA